MATLKKDEYEEGACCFEKPVPGPDTLPCPTALSVPDTVAKLDGLLEKGELEAGKTLLESALDTARAAGDWRSELSLLSELMGLLRRTGDSGEALTAVKDGLALIAAHKLGGTVSGATVTLNAATTLKAFGRAEESLPLFDEVLRVFAEELDPGDYRFAGLYNNMALSLADTGDFSAAESCFLRAMSVIRTCPAPENELAVTCCNLAELYERTDPEDERISERMEEAWRYLDAPDLPKDGYYAFTASKCAPTFGHFGFFIYEKELLARVRKIYEGA